MIKNLYGHCPLGLLIAVTACDPAAMTEAKHHFLSEPRLSYAEKQSLALENADALVIVTEWKGFRSPDFDSLKLKLKLKLKLVFDGRNLFESAEMKRLGFVCFGIGR